MKGFSNAKKRIVFHVDMDHFFSAVEERENPLLKGHPVVVGADPKQGDGRGVVKTCNYEARGFGIHSGMPISRAWRLCPNAIFVRANYKLYKKVSEQIMRILRGYADKFQQWGFDEAFLDVTSQAQNYEEATKLAIGIKHEVLWSEKLTCSIGIAANKLVAKIASDYDKPDGLTVVEEDAVEEFLAPLPVRKMLWIGEKTERRLNEIGIKTIGDLAAFDVSLLAEKFGVMGRRYHQWAHGSYWSEVGRRKGMRKSVGHEGTFSTDTSDHNLVLHRLDNLCQRIHEKIVNHNLLFKTVTVKIRYQSFQTRNHGKTLPFFTNSLRDLQKMAKELTQDYLCSNEKIRLVGVRVSSLASGEGQRILA